MTHVPLAQTLPTLDVLTHMVLVCIPAYQETEAELRNTIDSFRHSRDTLAVHLTIIVDGPDTQTIRGLQTVLELGEQPTYSVTNGFRFFQGILMAGDKAIPFLVIIKDTNTGKRDSHIHFFKILERSVAAQGALPARSSILFLDSDTSFAPDALQRLFDAVWDTSDPTIGGATGMIVPRWRSSNLIEASQHHDYIATHLTKAAQSVAGLVTCLAGAFSLCKTADLLDPHVLARYARAPETIIDHNKLQTGEDRYLTSLLLSRGHRIIFVANSKAYTTPPATVATLLVQRRRWTNSKFVNDLQVLTQPAATRSLFHRAASGYMHLITALDTALALTQAAVTFGITQALLRYFFSLSTHINTLAFGVYGVLFVALIVIMTRHQPQHQRGIYYFIVGAWCTYNALAMALLVLFFFQGQLLAPAILFGAYLAVLGIFTVQTDEARPSTLYGLITYLFLRPVFATAALFACCHIDDTSWGTRGGPAHLTRTGWGKAALLVGVIAANLALGWFLMQHVSRPVTLYLWWQLASLPTLALALWYMLCLSRKK